MNAVRTNEIEEAREADRRIADAWNRFYDAREKVAASQKRLRLLRSMYQRPDVLRGIEAEEAKLAERESAAKELARVANELDRELYKGWNRFFLVKHIHSSQNCSSFRETTRIGWLPEVSGLTESEAVAEYGATLCTICYRSAPVEK